MSACPVQIFIFVLNKSSCHGMFLLGECVMYEHVRKGLLGFTLQGVDTEGKEKGSKGEATKMFGANTPTVSCFFDSKSCMYLQI